MKESTSDGRVVIHTLGCRLNQFESQGLRNLLESQGDLLPSDRIHIINSCSVTSQADARCRNLIRSIHKQEPEAKIIVTGCYAQEDRESLEKIQGVTMVVGNDTKSSLPRILSGKPSLREKIRPGRLKVKRDGRDLPWIHNPFDYGDRPAGNRVRSILKIQEGCNRRCSYCRVPFSRGGARSRPYQEILQHVEALEGEGVPEIVLTGVNTADWREDSRKFWDLVESILDRLSVSRLRLASLEPAAIDKRAAECFNHPSLCNFLHVPIQSGSTRILGLMRRGISSEKIRERMETFLENSPPVFLGTDIMVGFPGETEEDFGQTLELVEQIGFHKIHSFRYSPRRGTPAYELKDRVPGHILDARLSRLHRLEEQNLRSYLERQIGKTGTAIVESKPARRPSHQGMLADSTTFRFPHGAELKTGETVQVRILSVDPSLEFLTGEILTG